MRTQNEPQFIGFRVPYAFCALSLVLSVSGCSFINGSVTREDFSSTTTTESAPTSSSPAEATIVTCSQVQTSSYGGGSGTAMDPYILSSVGHWCKLGATSTDWGSAFKLGSDINFSNLDGSTFPIVGTTATPFTGSLDGAGFSLKNLTMSSSSLRIAYFGYTSGASFSNLTVSNTSFTNTGGVGCRLGGLVGQSVGTLTLSSVQVSGLRLVGGSTATYAGGVLGLGVGLSYTTGSISNVTVSDTQQIGGVAGTLINGATSVSGVTISSLTFTANGLSSYMGGVYGAVSPGTGQNTSITNVQVTGASFSDSSNGYATGGLIGSHSIGMGATNSISITDSSASVTATGNLFSLAGGLIGDLFLSFGSSTTTLSILRSSATNNISAKNGFAGGLIGRAKFAGTLTINKSKANGSNVSGLGSSFAGGIIGWADQMTLNILDSYAAVTSVSAQNSGGLIGDTTTGVNGVVLVVQRNYVASNVSGTFTGCFVKNVGASLTSNDNFYDSDVCTLGVARQSGVMTNVTAQTTSNMQTSTTFTGSNWLGSVWSFPASAYPKQIWEP